MAQAESSGRIDELDVAVRAYTVRETLDKDEQTDASPSTS